MKPFNLEAAIAGARMDCVATVRVKWEDEDE